LVHWLVAIQTLIWWRREMKCRPLVLCLILMLACSLAPAAWAASLKVSSFPSGAEVWVDGVNTGKVTPMSISLAEGDHTVLVQIRNSGWNPDTRTVTIVAGNNDLSVTLLPTLTAGPQGLKGDKGDRGDKGDKGDQGIPGLQGIQGIQPRDRRKPLRNFGMSRDQTLPWTYPVKRIRSCR
jgi:hypothetical protein